LLIRKNVAIHVLPTNLIILLTKFSVDVCSRRNSSSTFHEMLYLAVKLFLCRATYIVYIIYCYIFVLYQCRQIWELFETLQSLLNIVSFERCEIPDFISARHRSWPFPVAARSKAWVYGRSIVRIAKSNPAGDMDISMSLVIVVCCQVEVSAIDRLLVQRSSTECCMSECDGQNSILWRPRITRVVEPWNKKNTRRISEVRLSRNYSIVTGYCSSSSITLTIRYVLYSHNFLNFEFLTCLEYLFFFVFVFLWFWTPNSRLNVLIKCQQSRFTQPRIGSPLEFSARYVLRCISCNIELSVYINSSLVNDVLK
jgi:hypothetical protein